MKFGVHHIALNAQNFDKCISFYKEGLGMTLVRSWLNGERKRCAMLDIGDGSLLEVFETGKEVSAPQPSYPHLAFRTESCDEAYNLALEHGATPDIAPKDVAIGGIYNVRIAFVYGPCGEYVEFFQER